jgi:alpha-glucosidase
MKLCLKHFLSCAIIAITCFPVRAQSGQRLTVTSPDKKIQATIIADGAQFNYTVSIDGQSVIRASKLGLSLKNGTTLGKDVAVVNTSSRSNNTSWKNPLGKSSTVRDQYNEFRIQLQERSAKNIKFEVIFRVFNDGLGFRYVLPQQQGLDSFIIEAEQTEFAFSGDYKCYYGHHEPKSGFQGSQEWEFNPGKLSDIKTDSIIGLPLLVQTPAAWIALTEADLLDWAGMWVSSANNATSSGKVALQTRLAPRLDGQGLVKAQTPHRSPWRVLMIGREPGTLVESNIILNLSTPSKIGDASWVKPGMMAWDHWWSGDVQMNTATLKQYIQLAADMGWPYQLIDWQWYGDFNKPTADITKVNPAVDMEEVRRLAKEKNVRLWVWLYWTDVERNDAYKKAFALYEQWGIAGIKIDFMDRDDQEMVNWYEKITKAAADHHLMVDFHGAYKPSGLERTYPNQVTREGILGNEYNRWSARVTSEHKLTLLFTRLLAGPADYTPGGFLNRQPAAFKPDAAAAQVQGTRASELALFVVYHSPVTVACDYPEHYKNEKGTDFLKIVPTVWDETRVLQAQVADLVVMAKRKDKEWFIGALTDSTPRQLSVPLNFLPKGRYKLQVWKDAKDSNIHAGHIEVEERIVSSSDQLVLTMVANGGYVARLQKE